MTILLIGATGNVGHHIARGLAGRTDVRALARSSSSADALRDLGVDPVPGDLDDPNNLDAAFSGVERLFLLTPFSERQADQEHSALDAAERSGVRGIVYLSLTGADSHLALARPHTEIEARPARSPFAVTVLRPDFFAQNLHGQIEPIRAGQLFFPTGDAAVAAVDVRDIADAAVAALTAADQPTGTYTITGPERLTFAEIAERIGAHLGRSVEHIDPPAHQWRDGLVQAGVPTNFADGLAEMFTLYQRTGGTAVHHGTHLLTGRAPRPIDDFIADELGPALTV